MAATTAQHDVRRRFDGRVRVGRCDAEIGFCEGRQIRHIVANERDGSGAKVVPCPDVSDNDGLV